MKMFLAISNLLIC